MHMYTILTVTQPTVSLTVPERSSYLAGSSLELSCLIDVTPDVDTNVTVTGAWLHDGTPLATGGRYTVTDPELTEVTNEYSSALQFSTLSSALDTATYTCEATVSSSNPLITMASATDFLSLTVDGMYEINHTVASALPSLEMMVHAYGLMSSAVTLCASCQLLHSSIYRYIQYRSQGKSP